MKIDKLIIGENDRSYDFWLSEEDSCYERHPEIVAEFNKLSVRIKEEIDGLIKSEKAKVYQDAKDTHELVLDTIKLLINKGKTYEEACELVKNADIFGFMVQNGIHENAEYWALVCMLHMDFKEELIKEIEKVLGK